MSKKTSILFSILLLVIGFATITTTLVLNGAVELASNNEDFKIIFTSVKLNNRKRNDFISADKQIINFESDKLTDIDDEAVIDYEVTNTSKMYDGEVTINCIVPNNEYVDIEYQPKNMIITSGKTKSGSITARLIKLSTSEQDINIKCTLDANALERETIGEDYIPPFSKSGVLMAYEENEKFWKFRSNITRVEFENELISHDTNDELIFDVLEDEKEKGSDIVSTIMESTVKLSTPLKVSHDFGIDLYETK